MEEFGFRLAFVDRCEVLVDRKYNDDGVDCNGRSFAVLSVDESRCLEVAAASLGRENILEFHGMMMCTRMRK